MVYVFGGLVALFLFLIVLAAVTGRVDARSCCTVADPRRDARMRAAFEGEEGRQAHLNGQIPAAPGQVGPDLLAVDPDIKTVDIIAVKETSGVRGPRNWPLHLGNCSALGRQSQVIPSHPLAP